MRVYGDGAGGLSMTAADPIWFDLNGVGLRIVASAEHLQPLSRYLTELRAAEQPAGARFDLSIVTQAADPRPDDGATLIFDGLLPGGAPCKLYDSDHGRLAIVPGHLSTRFSPSSAVMGVTPGSEQMIGGSVGILAIEAAAASGGQTLVHAAALTLPDDKGAIMLFAPSGAGKTTTALALALSGFGLLTDDALFLQKTAAGHTVWGLPRSLKVHRRTAAMLPALSPLLKGVWDQDGEQGLSRETLAGLVRLPKPKATPLAAVVLLGERTGTDGHHMAAAPRGEVLVRLAGDNVHQSPSGLLAQELRRFEALSHAVATTPVFELRVGADLDGLADTVVRALGGSL